MCLFWGVDELQWVMGCVLRVEKDWDGMARELVY